MASVFGHGHAAPVSGAVKSVPSSRYMFSLVAEPNDCERELVERDGTSFTMVLPFKDAEAARALLRSDPYYSRVRGQVGRALGRLDKVLHERDGKPAS